MPKLPRKAWQLLGLLGVAELFDHYDQALLSLALPQIQRDLEIPEAMLGTIGGIVRAGALFAIGLTVLADRWGRRRLLLVTIIGLTLSTLATAFVRTPAELVIVQCIGRLFMAAESMLAVVVIAEELAARDRGFGLGIMGALGSLGYGLAAGVLALVNLLPFGWRALYAIGVLPLLLMAWFRRSLKETRRFEQHARDRPVATGLRDHLRPLMSLAVMYPGRTVALCAAIFPYQVAGASVYYLVSKTLQDVHGYAPGQVTALYLIGGAVGITGNVVAGSLGDRIGRKRVMFGFVILFATAAAGFYNASGWLLPPLWIAMTFTNTGVSVMFSALGAELFPTSYRSTASGLRGLVSALGSVTGLFAESALYAALGSHALAITAMLPLAAVAACVLAWFVPETARRELEAIAPER